MPALKDLGNTYTAGRGAAMEVLLGLLLSLEINAILGNVISTFLSMLINRSIGLD
jgi:hypothetical protein